MRVQAAMYKAFLLISIILCVGGSLIPVSVSDSRMTLYFNYISEVSRRDDGAAFIYYQASDEPLFYPSAYKTHFKTAYKENYLGMDLYLGGVSWLTQPLTRDLEVNGMVEMHVWVSSDDPNFGWASGYGCGLAEIDENGDPVYGPIYGFSYTMGKAVDWEPREYILDFNIRHVFKKGHRMMFGFVAGSTSQGWSVTAHFSSEDKTCFALLPIIEEVQTEEIEILAIEVEGDFPRVYVQNRGESPITLQGAVADGEPKAIYILEETLSPGDSASVMVVCDTTVEEIILISSLGSQFKIKINNEL